MPRRTGPATDHVGLWHTCRVRRARLALLALGWFVLTSGCVHFPAAGQPNFAPLLVGRPMYQMDAQHTGRSPHVGVRQLSLLRPFNTSAVDLPDPVFETSDIQSSAAIAPDGTAYIGLHNGLLFAL